MRRPYARFDVVEMWDVDVPTLAVAVIPAGTQDAETLPLLGQERPARVAKARGNGAQAPWAPLLMRTIF